MAPAMKGLSPGWLVKTTNFAAPNPPLSADFSARSYTVCHSKTMASMLMPYRVEPTLPDEQTFWVRHMASGMALISSRSHRVIPLATSAENPPRMSTPTAAAASSSARAISTKPAASNPAPTWEMGVTAIRLLTTGMAYSLLIASQAETRLAAWRWIFSLIALQV